MNLFRTPLHATATISSTITLEEVHGRMGWELDVGTILMKQQVKMPCDPLPIFIQKPSVVQMAQG